MKSAGVYRASADFAKCGFAEMKFSGPESTLVKLQRPPPEIKIFLPARSACSSSATRRPRLPASMAHISPAAPAPRIRASNLCIVQAAREHCAACAMKDKEAGGRRRLLDFRFFAPPPTYLQKSAHAHESKGVDFRSCAKGRTKSA